MFFGLFLAIIGAIFLLQNLGYITADAGSVIWPVVLIVLGLSLVFKKKRGHCCGPWCWHGNHDHKDRDGENSKS